MISVYDIGNEAFERNGDAVLQPTEGKIRQVAGGGYDLTLTHRIDPEGKWAHLVPEAVIKAPVPEETIENARSGLDADVYVTTTEAALRDGPSEPTRITYSTWSQYNTYSVGSKVTQDNQNYQCIYWDSNDIRRGNSPASNPDWWAKIANYTGGAAVIVTLKAGAEVYYLENAGSGWYKVTTPYGLEGYIKASQVEYDRHLTPEETQPRKIKEQLFRIKTISKDTKTMTVAVTAEHVSNDLRGVLIDDIKVTDKNPATALAWIESAFMRPYRGTIASNMTQGTDPTWSGEIKGKNAVYAILDPDKGVVAKVKAEFRRDNWDLFIMRKTNTDRGFRLYYRKNLLGVNAKMNSENLVTSVVPVAKDADGNDFYLDRTVGTETGIRWVDSSHIDDYPVIYMERLKVNGQVGKDDGTETATNWTEQTLRAEMQSKAEERFDVDKADQLIHEITVDFEQLGDTDEYKAIRDLEKVLLYDTVIVKDERVGIDTELEVTELEWDIIREKVAAVKLANVNTYGGKNVTGFNVLNNSITGDKLTDDAGDAAKNQAVDESNGYTDNKISSLNSSLRAWVNQNFEPKAT